MPSFLDHLAPSRMPDAGIDRRRGPADLETCVRHDLQVLLNARRPAEELLTDYPDLQTSILNYGVRDCEFNEVLGRGERDVLAKHITDVIAAYEPRLTDVVVTAKTADEAEAQFGKDRANKLNLYFHISARLVAPGGGLESAEFENRFDWTTGRHEVTPS